MVADATRGIKFFIKTELDPNAEKAFRDTEKRVADLQKSMNLTLQLEGRVNGVNGANGSNGRNGTGSPQGGGAAARLADVQNSRREASERASRRRLSNMRREADERDRVQAEKTSSDSARFNQKILDQQIKDLRKAQAEREKAADQHAKRMNQIHAAGWKGLSGMGRESFTTNRKVNSGFEALSEMGRAAMPRDPFAEGLQRMAESRTGRSGFAGLGAAGAETQARLNNLRTIERRDAEERRRALESQKGQLREINSAAYDVAHSFGQMTRAATQFGLIGQRDMMKVLDTIFAVEGGLNAVQGGMNAFRAISSIRKARAGMGAAGGAAKWASGLANMGGAAGGIGGGAGAAAGAGGGVGLGTIGLAGAGATALAAGGAGILGTVADYNRGVGPGHVGGFWDTVGTKSHGMVNWLAKKHLGVIGWLEAKFNEPYGLTSRERALRTEGVQRNVSRYMLGGESAIRDLQTERLEEEKQQEYVRQRQMDLAHVSGFREQFGQANRLADFRRMTRDRNLMLRDNYSPLTREGPMLSDARGRHAAIGQQLSDVQGLQQRVADERSKALKQGGLTNILGERSEFDLQTSAQLVEYEKQIRELMKEQAAISREIQRTGIDGLKQQLELRKQMAEGARGRFESAFGAKQSLEERLGAMTPGKVRAIANAKAKGERGESLSLFEIENLELGDERSKFLAGEAKRRRFRGFAEDVRGTLGDVENFKFDATQGSMGAAAEGRDNLQQEIINQERNAGIGRPPPVMVDAKYTNEIKVVLDAAGAQLDELNQKFANEIAPKIEAAFQENVDRFADMITERIKKEMDNKIRRQNQQGRAGAGGGF